MPYSASAGQSPPVVPLELVPPVPELVPPALVSPVPLVPPVLDPLVPVDALPLPVSVPTLDPPVAPTEVPTLAPLVVPLAPAEAPPASPNDGFSTQHPALPSVSIAPKKACEASRVTR